MFIWSQRVPLGFLLILDVLSFRKGYFVINDEGLDDRSQNEKELTSMVNHIN